ncbi:hypothetical protein GWK47_039991 [Chionoecetes opilio]|uniref:Uncharacterized protein n=1 Tax=Chionoecetes opilio TaxID=41210 RepID=A0A8J5CXU7_CHIOP|nr:hypothetical protein GWK47_039991 [Chionoecetes opilio]
MLCKTMKSCGYVLVLKAGCSPGVFVIQWGTFNDPPLSLMIPNKRPLIGVDSETYAVGEHPRGLLVCAQGADHPPDPRAPCGPPHTPLHPQEKCWALCSRTGRHYRASLPASFLETCTQQSGRQRNSGDAAQIFHDTAGWRNLETSMKCLEHMITGTGHKFLPFINQDLLDRDFPGTDPQPTASCGRLASVCAGRWCPVGRRVSPLASLHGHEKFLMSLPPAARERFFPGAAGRVSASTGVRLYSQETWRQAPGADGKSLVEKFHRPCGHYYAEATGADNHAVREAACACIAELALKLTTDAVRQKRPPPPPRPHHLLHGKTLAPEGWTIHPAVSQGAGRGRGPKSGAGPRHGRPAHGGKEHQRPQGWAEVLLLPWMVGVESRAPETERYGIWAKPRHVRSGETQEETMTWTCTPTNRCAG